MIKHIHKCCTILFIHYETVDRIELVSGGVSQGDWRHDSLSARFKVISVWYMSRYESSRSGCLKLTNRTGRGLLFLYDVLSAVLSLLLLLLVFMFRKCLMPTHTTDLPQVANRGAKVLQSGFCFLLSPIMFPGVRESQDLSEMLSVSAALGYVFACWA